MPRGAVRARLPVFPESSTHAALSAVPAEGEGDEDDDEDDEEEGAAEWCVQRSYTSSAAPRFM